MQAIDVGDLAAWIVAAGARASVGTINAVGDPVGFAAFLGQAGESSLPLWLPRADVGFAQRSNVAFVAAGGVLRPLRETLARTLEDEVSRGLGRQPLSGLTAEQERRVVESILAR